jgi:hypothetical protein
VACREAPWKGISRIYLALELPDGSLEYYYEEPPELCEGCPHEQTLIIDGSQPMRLDVEEGELLDGEWE